MRIEHVAMYVNDLEKVRDFFIKYFNAVSNDLYHNPKTGFSSYFLSFEDGARLEVMNAPGLRLPDTFAQDNATTPTAGFAHIAFSLGSKEKVDELTALLKNDGYSVLSGPRTTGDGYYESCILGPEGNRIEITV